MLIRVLHPFLRAARIDQPTGGRLASVRGRRETGQEGDCYPTQFTACPGARARHATWRWVSRPSRPLSIALLLARWGVETVVLDDHPERAGVRKRCAGNTTSLGIAGRRPHGSCAVRISWTTARTFHHDEELSPPTYADTADLPFHLSSTSPRHASSRFSTTRSGHLPPQRPARPRTAREPSRRTSRGRAGEPRGGDRDDELPRAAEERTPHRAPWHSRPRPPRPRRAGRDQLWSVGRTVLVLGLAAHHAVPRPPHHRPSSTGRGAATRARCTAPRCVGPRIDRRHPSPAITGPRRPPAPAHRRGATSTSTPRRAAVRCASCGCTRSTSVVSSPLPCPHGPDSSESCARMPTSRPSYLRAAPRPGEPPSGGLSATDKAQASPTPAEPLRPTSAANHLSAASLPVGTVGPTTSKTYFCPEYQESCNPPVSAGERIDLT
jgi:hypothetical protein